MAHVELKPATREDAAYIGERVRKADFDELVVQTMEHPYYTMIRGIEANPDKAVTGWIDGRPVCMWGVTSAGMILKVGIPWMVGTDHLDKDARVFLRRCRKPVMELLDGYDMLVNYVDARNTRAIEWLKFCGFTVDDPEPYGFTRMPFHKFWMRREE